MKRLLSLILVCFALAPVVAVILGRFALAPVAAAEREPVAFAILAKPGEENALAAATAACPVDGFARHGLHEARFFTEVIDGRRVLLCTADLDRGKRRADVWRAVRDDPALGEWWTRFDATVIPHPRATADDPWIACETICRLRPDVPAAILGTTAPSWHASVTGLVEEKEAEYRMLHANVWPGVIDAIGQSGISRFDIFLIDLDDQVYLFSLFEFVGKDLARDTAAMGENPVNQRWWKVTDACQEPLPSAAARTEIWEPMEPATAAPDGDN